MKFVELTELEFNEYIKSAPIQHFMQSIDMKNYYKLKNTETYLIGVKIIIKLLQQL